MRLTRFVLMIVPLLLAGGALARSGPINVLVMHWYDRGYPSNEGFDRALQNALQSVAPDGVEYYSEYLETNRFPGDEQARLLSDYLRRKYAGQRLDAIIASVSETLDFLLKHRHDMFPGVPIVFATERPIPEAVRVEAGAAGFTFGNAFAKTLNLALQWHPETKQLFVVSGTLDHDKAVESIVRNDLRQYENIVTITYLTDLAPGELTTRIRTLPKNSLILYVWQQVRDPKGRLLEASDILARVADAAKVPIYGRSYAMIGHGIVGGYVWTQEGNAARLADITMQIVNGTPPKDIPVEKGPEIPMFDWRQLQRWGIRSERLPPGTIVQFRDASMWQQYKWRIIGAFAVLVLQGLLIAALLVLRKRGQRRAVALLEARRVLQESEERFRRVFEEGPLGLALVGKDYRFVKVNNALCLMVGYDEAALTQMSFLDITHPDDVFADVELAERLFKGEVPFYRIQKRYLKKSGEFIWINLTASIIHGSDGETLYGLAMVEDITEMKRTQDEALFRQKLESVGTLAGGIAHDFNNLLGAVQAQAELGLGEIQSGSSSETELKAIRDVATRGSEIVNQLMIYAGQETGVVDLVDLSRIVNEMISLLKVSVTKRATLQAALDPKLPLIRASAAQLRQVVMNLITNASDAMGDRDGVIRVITQHAIMKGQSASPPLPDGDYVRLEVSDTGRGMSRETQAKVFDPFFTTKSAGRGLGLAVVQGIVRSLGGAIQIVSEPGKGTTISILLPCAKTKDSAIVDAHTGGSQLAVGSQRGTVLVVEDEAQLREPVVKMLRKTGFAVSEAADGTAAIDLLRLDGDKFDVVLLDMTLPGATSDEIVAEAAKAQPAIRVILTSAYSREAIAGAMSSPQICGFIRKPFPIKDLVQEFRRAMASESGTAVGGELPPTSRV
jgi:PAS domain S-box-containing protein